LWTSVQFYELLVVLSYGHLEPHAVPGFVEKAHSTSRPDAVQGNQT